MGEKITIHERFKLIFKFLNDGVLYCYVAETMRDFWNISCSMVKP